MIKELRAISEARNFRRYSESTTLDAVFASTSHARWMDIARADAAVDAVENVYRNVGNYEGLWIAGGWLGGVPYEESQRKGIVDRLVQRGVDEDRIIQIDGKDTVDKVRELTKLPPLKKRGFLFGFNLGIASYPLHIARFNLALKHAQAEGYAPQLEITGIPTSYDARPSSDHKNRPLNDQLFGWLGLLKDARRLEKYGFEGSVPGDSSGLHTKLRELNSEDGRRVKF